MKILHLIDSFTSGDSPQQVKLLSEALADRGLSVEVCCLGPTTPWLEELRQAGVLVHPLGWTRWFDPGVLWNLRAVLKEATPDLIHVWRLPALRTLALVAGDALPRVVLSEAWATRGKLTWWDRQLVKQVRCVAAATAGDGERCVQQGIRATRVRIAAPLVETAREQNPDAPAIVCAGPLEREYGFRNAVWAFDFMRYLEAELTLKFVGAGTQRALLETLVHGLELAHCVQFLDSDPAPVLQSARIVWVPSVGNCGRQTVLDAMAAGRPVVASDVPCLREIIEDGVNGFLSQPGEIVQLGRRTRTLLFDVELRRRIGAAAQTTVQQSFAMKHAVAAWRAVYQDMAA